MLSPERTTVKTCGKIYGMKARSQAPPRLPENYQVVFDILREHGTGTHLTTGDVYAVARTRKQKIGYSTVYRGLLRLRDLGLASEIVVPGTAAAVYEPAGPQHAHFRCDACGAVRDVDFDLSKRALRTMEERSGVKIQFATVTLHGRCGRCA